MESKQIISTKICGVSAMNRLIVSEDQVDQASPPSDQIQEEAITTILTILELKKDYSNLAQDWHSQDADTLFRGYQAYWSQLRRSPKRAAPKTYDRELSSMLLKNYATSIFWHLTYTARLKLALTKRRLNDLTSLRAFLQSPGAVDKTLWEGLHAEYINHTGEQTTLQTFVLSFDFLLSPLPVFLPSIRELLGDFLPVFGNENHLDTTPKVNDNIHGTNLCLSDPTPRPASDLQNYRNTPHNQPEIIGGSVSKCTRPINGKPMGNSNIHAKLPGTEGLRTLPNTTHEVEKEQEQEQAEFSPKRPAETKTISKGGTETETSASSMSKNPDRNPDRHQEDISRMRLQRELESPKQRPYEAVDISEDCMRRNFCASNLQHPRSSFLLSQSYQEILESRDESLVVADASGQALQEHEREAELKPTTANSVKQRYECLHPGCRSSFSTSYLLSSHGNVHSKDRPYLCPQKGCGLNFKRRNEQKRHMFVHSSPGYKCPYCPKERPGLLRPDNLIRHVKQHHTWDPADAELQRVLDQRPTGKLG